MADRLKGKVAIVGGGTSGIGMACVKLFAAEGAKVVFSGLEADVGREMEQELAAKGQQGTYLEANLAKVEDMKRLVDKTVELFGAVDVLVNNVAISTRFSLHEMDLDKDYYPLFELNVKSYLVMMQLVLPYMMRQKSGSIVNISSISGSEGSAKMSTYAATKGAVNQITRSIAQEYAPYNIRCNAVAPGMTWTGKMVPGSAHANASLAVIPLGRAGEPIEQAYAALFFASDECPYCTGAILNVDGGQSCGPMRHED